MATHAAADRLPRSVWIVSGVTVAVLLGVSAWYGFHRDELYFVAAGRRLAWGYVDQPPLTPLIARVADLLPGNVSATALRIVPAFSAGGVVLIAAAMARRFGGSKRAMLYAAFFAAVSGFFLAVGHLLSTSTFDVLIWAAVILVVVALIDGADPRFWMLVGALMGVGMLNKNTVAALGIALLVGLLATPQRSIVKGRWLWFGVGIALLISLPNLVWQQSNGWPQVEMAKVLAAKADGPADYLLLQLAILSVFLIIPATMGAIWLWRDPIASRWRAIVIAFVFLFVIFLVTRGKGYYVAPLYLPLLAAGAVRIDQGSEVVRRTVMSLIVVGAVIGVPLALPVLPAENIGPFNEINKELGETYGWDQFVDQIETVYLFLPSDERTNAAILTANYGQAGAIEVLGEGRLPQPVSGHNSYGDWGPGPEHGTIIGIGFVPDAILSICPSVDQVAMITNAALLENDEFGTPVWICREPTGQLASIWADIKHFS